MTRSLWLFPQSYGWRRFHFLERTLVRDFGSFRLCGICPISQRALNKFNRFLWLYRADNRDHHPARTKCSAVKILQILARDGLDGLRPPSSGRRKG